MKDRAAGIRATHDLAERLMRIAGDHPALPDHALDWGIEIGVRLAIERPEYAQALAARLGRFGPKQCADIDQWIAANPVQEG